MRYLSGQSKKGQPTSPRTASIASAWTASTRAVNEETEGNCPQVAVVRP